mmetsp:Transcript_28312/g.40047  ORF Transcript_28312/g.40047 Transcript_28312/m.40047 type:complete len:239 (+) Transcript_28312:1067-1783(+)
MLNVDMMFYFKIEHHIDIEGVATLPTEFPESAPEYCGTDGRIYLECFERRDGSISKNEIDRYISDQEAFLHDFADSFQILIDRVKGGGTALTSVVMQPGDGLPTKRNGEECTGDTVSCHDLGTGELFDCNQCYSGYCKRMSKGYKCRPFNTVAQQNEGVESSGLIASKDLCPQECMLLSHNPGDYWECDSCFAQECFQPRQGRDAVCMGSDERRLLRGGDEDREQTVVVPQQVETISI